jgi:hypothetical protein
VRRVYLEIDRLSVDAFVASSYARSLCLNLPPYFGKIVEFPTRNVIKLCPFLLPCDASRSMWDMNLVFPWPVVSFAGYIDELENQGASSNDATSSGQEVSADYVFQDGGLPGGLGSNNDLRFALVGDAADEFQEQIHTIWGKSRESFPMVLNTRSWSLLTTWRRSSPSEAIVDMYHSAVAW